MTPLGHNPEFMTLLSTLYQDPALTEHLVNIKTRLREAVHYAQPQYDDIEAEILCLLLQHHQPKVIYEFSPCGGWSTLHLLMSAPDATVDSFDVEDHASRTIARFPDLQPRFTLHVGDVMTRFRDFPLDTIDCLFIDSDHCEAFAKQYVNDVLRPLLLSKQRILVSVHDVFHAATPSEEGAVVIEFLKEAGIKYFAPVNVGHADEIGRLRSQAGLASLPRVHVGTANPSMYFFLGG